MLELKSQNYVLGDNCRRNELELSKEKQRYEMLEKELNKYQNLAKLNPLSFAKSFQLNKNKDKEQKERETVDQLQLENEHLQHKIQLQEDEFRLTNETLRQEISRLLKESEVLNAQLRLSHGPDQDGHDRIDSSNVRTQEKFKEIEMIPRPEPLNCNSQLSYAMLKEKEQLEVKLGDLSGKVSQLEETNRHLHQNAKDLVQLKEEKSVLEGTLDQTKKSIAELESGRKQLQENLFKVEVRYNSIRQELF
jgi:chromosome segregation ATPase